jgi:hypothetical protein
MRTLAEVSPTPPGKAPASTKLEAPPMPELEISTAQVFGAVEQAPVVVSVPAGSLGGQRVTRGAWSFDFARDGTKPIPVELRIQDGRVQPDVSKLTFDPPLSIKVVGKGLRPNPDITVRSATIRDAGPGRGRLDLDIDIEHTGLELLDIIPGWDTEEYLEDLMAEKVFGSARFPLDGEALVRNMAENAGILPATVLVGGRSERSVPSPAMAADAKQVMATLNLGGASISVENAVFAPEHLDLGNGQGMELRPESQLSVRGTPRDFTITGHAVLGPVDIGSGDNRAALERGEAELSMRVQTDAAGKQHFTVDITEIKDVTNLTAVGRVGAGVTHATFAKVAGGAIHLESGDGRNELELALTGVEGELRGGADVGMDQRRYTAQSFVGKVEGDITLDNGAVRGTLRHVDLEVAGLSVDSPETGRSAGSLSIRGQAEVTFDKSGRLVLARAGTGFQIDTDMVTGRGARYQIHGGSADRLEVSGGEPPVVTARNTTAQFGCVTAIGQPTPEGRVPTLDIRRASIHGDIQLGGKDGFRTLGQVRMHDVDASVGDLSVKPSAASLLDLAQLDFSGNGLLEVSRDGGWVISEDTTLPPAQRGITATGLARDLRFATDSPEIHLDLAANAHAVFDVNHLTLGGNVGTSIDLGTGYFEGTVEAGTVTVGDESSMLNRVRFKPGTLVRADVGHLKSGRYVQGRNLATDVTLRIEGAFGDEVNPTEEYGVRLQKLGFSGDMRMLLRAQTDGNGNFSARSHSNIFADAEAHVSKDLDPAATYAEGVTEYLAGRRKKAEKPRQP